MATFCDHIAVAIGHCEKNESGQHQMSEGINRLQALQQQLAMAEQKKEEAAKEQGRAKFMMELSKSLAGSLEIDSVIHNVCEQTKKLLECDRVTLFVKERDGRTLYTRVAEGADTIRVPMNYSHNT